MTQHEFGATSKKSFSKSIVHRSNRNAQVTVEFTLCFILALVLFYGAIMAIRWAGVSLAERRQAHEDSMTQHVSDDYGSLAGGPLKQLSTEFYDGTKMNLVFDGN